MKKLLLAAILATLPTAPWAKGYFEAKVSDIHFDQNGVSFTTTNSVADGCPAANSFLLRGNKDSVSYRTLVDILEKARKSNRSIGIWADGCGPGGGSNVMYLGAVGHV